MHAHGRPRTTNSLPSCIMLTICAFPFVRAGEAVPVSTQQAGTCMYECPAELFTERATLSLQSSVPIEL
jgi:hypothetical protein